MGQSYSGLLRGTVNSFTKVQFFLGPQKKVLLYNVDVAPMVELLVEAQGNLCKFDPYHPHKIVYRSNG